MQIDVSTLLHNIGERLEISGQSVLEPITIGCNTFGFKKPVDVSVVLTSLGDSIELTAKASGEAVADCARCSCSVEVPFEISLEELLKKSTEDNDDSDVVLFSGSVVDLSDIIADNFALNAPMRVLCKDDCNGLCPVCGADLNISDCGCEKDIIDPRFSVLDQLFKDNK